MYIVARILLISLLLFLSCSSKKDNGPNLPMPTDPNLGQQAGTFYPLYAMEGAIFLQFNEPEIYKDENDETVLKRLNDSK